MEITLLAITKSMIKPGLAFFVRNPEGLDDIICAKDGKAMTWVIDEVDEEQVYCTSVQKGTKEKFAKKVILENGFTTREFCIKREDFDGDILGTIPLVKGVKIKGSYGSKYLRSPDFQYTERKVSVKEKLKQNEIPFEDIVPGKIISVKGEWDMYIVLETHFEDGYIIGLEIPCEHLFETKILREGNPTLVLHEFNKDGEGL